MRNAAKHREAQRSASLSKVMVRTRNAGEPLRPPAPIKCAECCDMPWRRVDHLCKPGRCFGCGLPHEEENAR